MSHDFKLTYNLFQPSGKDCFFPCPLQTHIVYVGHPSFLVIEFYTVGACLQVKSHIILLEGHPVRCTHIYGAHFLTIQHNSKRTCLGRTATEMNCIVSLFCDIDITPHQRVASLSTKPTGKGASACSRVGLINSRTYRLIVVDFLIIMHKTSLRLVNITVQSVLSLQLVDACSMWWNHNRQRAYFLAQVLMFEQVTHLYLTAQIYFTKAEAHFHFPV